MKLRNRRLSGFHACWMNAAKRAVSRPGNCVSPDVRKRAREQQGARVVVDAIAMSAIRHGMDGMLEHARTVAERKEMPDLHLRDGEGPCLRERSASRQRNSVARPRARPRRPRDSAWLFAPMSSTGWPHKRVCAWHAGGHRLSAGRKSRCPWLWHPRTEPECRAHRRAVPWRANKVSTRPPFPSPKL